MANSGKFGSDFCGHSHYLVCSKRLRVEGETHIMGFSFILASVALYALALQAEIKRPLSDEINPLFVWYVIALFYALIFLALKWTISLLQN
jgi:hypothetical protein